MGGRALGGQPWRGRPARRPFWEDARLGPTEIGPIKVKSEPHKRARGVRASGALGPGSSPIPHPLTHAARAFGRAAAESGVWRHAPYWNGTVLKQMQLYFSQLFESK